MVKIRGSKKLKLSKNVSFTEIGGIYNFFGNRGYAICIIDLGGWTTINIRKLLSTRALIKPLQGDQLVYTSGISAASRFLVSYRCQVKFREGQVEEIKCDCGGRVA